MENLLVRTSETKTLAPGTQRCQSRSRPNPGENGIPNVRPSQRAGAKTSRVFILEGGREISTYSSNVTGTAALWMLLSAWNYSGDGGLPTHREGRQNGQD